MNLSHVLCLEMKALIESLVFVSTNLSFDFLIFVVTNKIIESLWYIARTNEIILVFASTNDRDSFLLHYMLQYFHDIMLI